MATIPLEKALKSAKITRFAVQKKPSPEPAALPLPSLTLVVPIRPKSPDYDVEAAEESPPPAPRKSRRSRYEPFHGGVVLMSLQEKFDALADQVLSETEEGVRMSRELRTKWWGFRFLGG